MTILQDVDLDFSRVAQLIGAKFELKTRSELGLLEAELATLTGPEISQANALTVTLNPQGDGNLPANYFFDSTFGKFATTQHFRSDLNVNTLDFDLSTADLRAGEKFLYVGPEGAQAFTFGAGAIQVGGEQILKGNGNEIIEVLQSFAGGIFVIVTPLTRGEGAGNAAVAYFATVDIVPGVPLNVMHNLNLIDKDAFNIRAYQPGGTGNQVNLDVDGVDANNLTITSLLPRLGVKIFVTGLAA